MQNIIKMCAFFTEKLTIIESQKLLDLFQKKSKNVKHAIYIYL